MGERYVAVHSFEKAESGDLEFNSGDIIIVTASEGDWWTGSVEGGDGSSGIFPSDYVEKEGLTAASVGETRLVASHEYVSDVSTDLNFAIGDAIIGIELHSGWWTGRHVKTGEEGQFPEEYVHLEDSEEGRLLIQEQMANKSDSVRLIALHDFDDAQEGDLVFKEGDYIVGTKLKDGWWTGRHELTGNEGNFPSNFVDISDPKSQNHSKDEGMKQDAKEEAKAKVAEEEATAKTEARAAEEEAKAKAVEEEVKAKAKEEAKSAEEKAKAKAKEEAKAAGEEAKPTAEAAEEEVKAKARAKISEEKAKARAAEEKRQRRLKEAQARAAEVKLQKKMEEEAEKRAQQRALKREEAKIRKKKFLQLQKAMKAKAEKAAEDSLREVQKAAEKKKKEEARRKERALKHREDLAKRRSEAAARAKVRAKEKAEAEKREKAEERALSRTRAKARAKAEAAKAKEEERKYVIGLHNNQPASDSGLPFRRGDLIRVTSREDSKWLTGFVVNQPKVRGEFAAASVELETLFQERESKSVMRLVAVKSYSSPCKEDISFSKNQVLIGVSFISGWWRGYLENVPNKQGFFPTSCVHSEEREGFQVGRNPRVGDEIDVGKVGRIKLRALHDYNAGEGDEVSVREGQIIWAYSKSNNGEWWDCLVASSNQKGRLPCNHTHQAPLSERDIRENKDILDKQLEESRLAAREKAARIARERRLRDAERSQPKRNARNIGKSTKERNMKEVKEVKVRLETEESQSRSTKSEAVRVGERSLMSANDQGKRRRRKKKKKTNLPKRERDAMEKAEGEAKLRASRSAAIERGLKFRRKEAAERRDLHNTKILQHRNLGHGSRKTANSWKEDKPNPDDIEFTQFVGEGTAFDVKKELPSTSYFATDGESLNCTNLVEIKSSLPPQQSTVTVATEIGRNDLPSVPDHFIEELHDLADEVMDLATMQIDFTAPKHRRRNRKTGRPESGSNNGVYDGTGLPMPRLQMPKHIATKDMIQNWEIRRQFRAQKEKSRNTAILDEDSLVEVSAMKPVRPDGSRMPYHSRSPRSPTYHALISSRSPDAFFNARRLISYGGYENANEAASQIQAIHRGRQARRAVLIKRKEYDASVKIQSAHRGKEARRESMRREKARQNARKGRGVHSIGDRHLDAEGTLIQHTERQMVKIEREAKEKEEEKQKLAKSSRFPRRRRRGSTGGGGGGSTFGIVTGRLDVKEFNARVQTKKNSAGQPLSHSMDNLPWVDRACKIKPSLSSTGSSPYEDKCMSPIRHFLQLSHVHGFRSHDMRNNVLYTASGDVLMIAATLGICLNLKTNSQRYMSEHDEDIISFAVHHIRKKRNSYSRVATGDAGRNPKIVIWETHTMRVLTVLRDSHQHRGISQLAFTKDGTNLASICLGPGDDGGHKQAELFIHNWKKRELLLRHMVGGEKLFHLSFWPNDQTRLITCGVKQMKFWHCKSNRMKRIESTPARFPNKLAGSISALGMCYDCAGRAVCATDKGHLLVWLLKQEDSVCLNLNQGSIAHAHRGPINSLAVVPGGEQIVSGGADGRVRVWTCPNSLKAHISPGPIFESAKFVQSPTILESSLQSLSVSSDKHIIMATRGGDVVAINLKDGSMVRRKPINSGHNEGELWGLAAHPSDPDVFATSGDDCTVRLWHTELKTCFAVSKPGTLPTKSRALCFSPLDGDFLAVGQGGRQGRNKPIGTPGRDDASGDVLILDSESLVSLYRHKVANGMISDVSWSQDKHTIAVASHDKCIYLLAFASVPDISLSTRSVLEGHAGHVQHVSYSQDSEWLMSNDIAGDLHFWSNITGKDVSLSITDSLKNADWFPNKCPLNWAAKGIWPEDAQILDVNACEIRGHFGSGSSNGFDQDYIVTADEFGNVKLFNAPITQWCAPAMVHRGHSAHVTNVCFNSDGTQVFSIGGEDRCVFVWRMSVI